MKYAPDKNLLFEMLLHSPPQALAALLQVVEMSPPPLLVPVPLHPSREKQRGFNQATIVGLCLSQLTNIPLLTGAVVRTKKTKQQAQISAKKPRIENMRDAFECVDKETLKRHSIILVDDVVTTGATVRETLLAIGKAQSTTAYIMCLAHERA